MNKMCTEPKFDLTARELRTVKEAKDGSEKLNLIPIIYHDDVQITSMVLIRY